MLLAVLCNGGKPMELMVTQQYKSPGKVFFLLLKQQHHLVHRLNMVNNKNTCTLKTFFIKPFVRKKAMNPHSSLASQFMKLSNLAAH